MLLCYHMKQCTACIVRALAYNLLDMRTIQSLPAQKFPNNPLTRMDTILTLHNEHKLLDILLVDLQRLSSSISGHDTAAADTAAAATSSTTATAIAAVDGSAVLRNGSYSSGSHSRSESLMAKLTLRMELLYFLVKNGGPGVQLSSAHVDTVWSAIAGITSASSGSSPSTTTAAAAGTAAGAAGELLMEWLCEACDAQASYYRYYCYCYCNCLTCPLSASDGPTCTVSSSCVSTRHGVVAAPH
jgi:hypothetical protein